MSQAKDYRGGNIVKATHKESIAASDDGTLKANLSFEKELAECELRTREHMQFLVSHIDYIKDWSAEFGKQKLAHVETLRTWRITAEREAKETATVFNGLHAIVRSIDLQKLTEIVRNLQQLRELTEDAAFRALLVSMAQEQSK